jgi:dipeptidyl aminopeptidase/acylaminoacyl peptidase
MSGSPKALFCLALLFVAPSAFPQSKHTPTIEELLSLKYVSSPKISPDGSFVAYELQETDWTNNHFVNQIWLADTATGKNIQLTRGKQSAGSASWSPDGKWLAFLTQRDPASIEPPSPAKGETAGDKPASQQIWLLSPQGGEAWQLTNSPSDVGEFHWSNDSQFIAFTAAAPENKANKERTEKYGDFQVFEKDYRQNHLWSVNVWRAQKDQLPQSATRLISDPSLNVTGFTWSPDSTQIAVSATPNPSLASFGDQHIYLLQLSRNNAVKKVVAFAGPNLLPTFSPDGKQLAFVTWLAQPDFFFANAHIAVVEVDKVLDHPAAAPSDVRDLTARFDESPNPVTWSPAGIYFLAEQKTSTHLFCMDPQTAAVRRVTFPDNLLLEGVSFAPGFKSMAFVAEDASHMPELYASVLDSFSPKPLTHMTAQVENWNLGAPEIISWTSQDGTPIEGILYKPAGYDRSRKYPLLVEIHGGPADSSHAILSPAGYAYPFQLFLARGALVLKPNYRGSSGYGAAFRTLNVRNIGEGEMSDVMSGINHLMALGIVDPDRLGVMGSSWGGYVSSFLETHTTRFRAISESSGPSDTLTEYANTDIPQFIPQLLHAKPWDDPAIYNKTSPVTTVKQAGSPILIQHGKNDHRVPLANAFEFYRALQDQGVDAHLIIYSGFGHGVNEPKSMRAVMQGNLDWFSHYLWNEPIPPNSPLLSTSEQPANQ